MISGTGTNIEYNVQGFSACLLESEHNSTVGSDHLMYATDKIKGSCHITIIIFNNLVDYPVKNGLDLCVIQQ